MLAGALVPLLPLAVPRGPQNLPDTPSTRSHPSAQCRRSTDIVSCPAATASRSIDRSSWRRVRVRVGVNNPCCDQAGGDEARGHWANQKPTVLIQATCKSHDTEADGKTSDSERDGAC